MFTEKIYVVDGKDPENISWSLYNIVSYNYPRDCRSILTVVEIVFKTVW